MLAPPDVNPRNVFLTDDGQLKLFDFDNLMFLDPTYHVARCIFTLIRAATDAGIWNAEQIFTCLRAFVSAYREALMNEGCGLNTETSDFANNVQVYAATTFVSYYFMSARAMSLTPDQIDTVVRVGRSMRRGIGW